LKVALLPPPSVSAISETSACTNGSERADLALKNFGNTQKSVGNDKSTDDDSFKKTNVSFASQSLGLSGDSAAQPNGHDDFKKRPFIPPKPKRTSKFIKNGTTKVKHTVLKQNDSNGTSDLALKSTPNTSQPSSSQPSSSQPSSSQPSSSQPSSSQPSTSHHPPRHRPLSVHFSSPTCTTFSEPALHIAVQLEHVKCNVSTQTQKRKRRKKRCCKWMLAATLRSCFGPCFKRLGTPSGYDSIEDVPSSGDIDQGRRLDNGYETVATKFPSHGLDYRSKSTSEIFRSNDFYYNNDFMKPDKRSFSASFGYLNENELFETLSQGMRSTLTSANDLRSDMSEAFWSCRGSLSRSSTGLDSEQDFYSDESEEPHKEEYTVRPVCENCGSSGRDHHFDEQDKCNWRESSLTSSLPVPKSQKWIQLE